MMVFSTNGKLAFYAKLLDTLFVFVLPIYLLTLINMYILINFIYLIENAHRKKYLQQETLTLQPFLISGLIKTVSGCPEL